MNSRHQLSANAIQMAQVLGLGACAAPGLGGIWLRGPAGELRDGWLQQVRETLNQVYPGKTIPWVKAAGHWSVDRFEDCLDLAATLQQQKPVNQPGVLSRVNGGILVLSMAEHATPALLARLMAALDQHQLTLIAMDESVSDEPGQAQSGLASGLAQRLELVLDLPDRLLQENQASPFVPDRLQLLSSGGADAPKQVYSSFVQCALALGLTDLRIPLAAVRVARLVSAWRGIPVVDDAAMQWAVAAVMLRRAAHMPQTPEPPEPAGEPAQPEQQEPPSDPADDTETALDEQQIQALSDQVIAACLARVPAQLLMQLQAQRERARAGAAQGSAGARRRSVNRGRPIGERRGLPRGGARLHVLASLRAAAPWQQLRRKNSAVTVSNRVIVTKSDLHVRRFEQHAPTLTLFVVDASGSAALHRLNEAKGAVELLLADCYVRRDQVALVAFRAQQAHCVLAPTRSLVAAKKQLAQMPAGGATPLAAALQETIRQVRLAQRAGQTPLVVLLTDGRANIALDGSAGRELAHADALRCARTLASMKSRIIVLDTSAQPGPRAQELADTLAARYLPLPYADAHEMSASIKAASQS